MPIIEEVRRKKEKWREFYEQPNFPDAKKFVDADDADIVFVVRQEVIKEEAVDRSIAITLDSNYTSHKIIVGIFTDEDAAVRCARRDRFRTVIPFVLDKTMERDLKGEQDLAWMESTPEEHEKLKDKKFVSVFDAIALAVEDGVIDKYTKSPWEGI